MAKNGAFNKMYMIVPMVILGLSSMADAVEIIFYSSGCSGSGYTVNNAGNLACYVANAGASAFILTFKTGVVYRGGACNSTPYNYVTGNVCYSGGGFTSAYWYYNCRRRSLLGEVTSNVTKCETDFKPTGLAFTEDSGTWILKSSNATQLMSQIENLTAVEKLSWFKAHGASFDNTAVTQNVPLN